MKRLLFFIFTLIITSTAHAQVNADSLFIVAKTHVENGEYNTAREVLLPALEAYPEYHDIRTYIGRTYAWEGDYTTARQYFYHTLEHKGDFGPAWIALGDIGLWAKDYPQTIEDMDSGLNAMKNDTATCDELHVRKADALNQTRNYREALSELEGVHTPRAERLRQGVLLRLVNNSIDITGTAEFFSRDYDNMYYSTIQAGQATKYGVAIARVNTATRFGETGVQGEVDLYPRITNSIYGYVNYGYSANENVFPEHRLGGELYSALGHRFEVSLGMRYLYFASNSSVTMYTGSVSYYAGKYLFSIRPFITPKDNGTDMSYAVLVRRYLKDSRSWINLKGNFGFSPDPNRIQVGAGDQISILRTTQVAAEWQQAVSMNWLFILGFKFTNQELPYAPQETVNIYSPTIGIKRLL